MIIFHLRMAGAVTPKPPNPQTPSSRKAHSACPGSPKAIVSFVGRSLASRTFGRSRISAAQIPGRRYASVSGMTYPFLRAWSNYRLAFPFLRVCSTYRAAFRHRREGGIIRLLLNPPPKPVIPEGAKRLSGISRWPGIFAIKYPRDRIKSP